KYEREAKEKNRETWLVDWIFHLFVSRYLSWALDTNQEERDKGKTVEVGRAYFETEKKHFTILDAPGHKSFVPNMIGGASQADLAVLVISARKGEFETGFEKGGQTREHAMLAKTAGVKHLIVLVNKMDDPTVNWSLERKTAGMPGTNCYPPLHSLFTSKPTVWTTLVTTTMSSELLGMKSVKRN
ncbi:Eukaryotic peptide chain release factor GTP-binding subunit ERF3B, partial [Xenoophorus captivus]